MLSYVLLENIDSLELKITHTKKKKQTEKHLKKNAIPLPKDVYHKLYYST